MPHTLSPISLISYNSFNEQSYNGRKLKISNSKLISLLYPLKWRMKKVNYKKHTWNGSYCCCYLTTTTIYPSVIWWMMDVRAKREFNVKIRKVQHRRKQSLLFHISIISHIAKSGQWGKVSTTKTSLENGLSGKFLSNCRNQSIINDMWDDDWRWVIRIVWFAMPIYIID